MSDYPEPAAGRASAWTRVGGALVDRDDILKAISALSGVPDSDTVIIKSLKAIGSPLAGTDYRGLADQYMGEHPEDGQPEASGLKHPPRRRVAFTRMLERHLRKLDELAHAVPVAGDPADLAPLDDADARARITRDVVARQGQAQFRNMLIQAYAGRCAVTGCDTPYALEAAHIRPYRGEHTNIVANGCCCARTFIPCSTWPCSQSTRRLSRSCSQTRSPETTTRRSKTDPWPCSPTRNRAQQRPAGRTMGMVPQQANQPFVASGTGLSASKDLTTDQ